MQPLLEHLSPPPRKQDITKTNLECSFERKEEEDVESEGPKFFSGHFWETHAADAKKIDNSGNKSPKPLGKMWAEEVEKFA